MEQQTPITDAAVPEPTPEKPKTSWMALAGILVLTLVLAGGALYLKSTTPDMPEGVVIEAIEQQGTSTEPEAIEADLAVQSPDEFDQEFDAAFAELDSAVAE